MWMVGYHCIDDDDDDDDMSFQTIEHNFLTMKLYQARKNFMQLTNQNKIFPFKV